MDLRSYQEDCVQAIFNELKISDSALVSLPCGTGKTIIFCKFIDDTLKKNSFVKVIVLVNKNILINQTVEKLQKFVSEDLVGVYSAGLGEKCLDRPITVASIQSIHKQLPEGIDVLLADEVHGFDFDNPLSMISILFASLDCKVVGFTATPYSAKGSPIYGADKFFKYICYQKKMREMTDENFLAPLVFQNQKADTKIDISGVKKIGGEYVLSHLSSTILKSKDKIDMQVDDLLIKSGGCSKVAILCCNIEHAEYVYSLIEDACILHSKMSPKEQKRHLDEFSRDKKFLISVMMITTGFDFPELDCLALMRPTRSKVLYVQAAGRVARLYPGKEDALLLDYGQIIEEQGTPYEVSENPRLSKQDTNKLCPICDTFNQNTAHSCSACGQRFITICLRCDRAYPYGDSCPNCGVNKVDRDPYRLLTTSAVSHSKHRHVTEVAAKWTVSQTSGKKMFRVDYFRDLRLLASEFFTDKSRYYYNKFCMDVYGEVISSVEVINRGVPVVGIDVYKENGFFKIEKRYIDGRDS